MGGERSRSKASWYQPCPYCDRKRCSLELSGAFASIDDDAEYGADERSDQAAAFKKVLYFLARSTTRTIAWMVRNGTEADDPGCDPHHPGGPALGVPLFIWRESSRDSERGKAEIALTPGDPWRDLLVDSRTPSPPSPPPRTRWWGHPDACWWRSPPGPGLRVALIPSIAVALRTVAGPGTSSASSRPSSSIDDDMEVPPHSSTPMSWRGCALGDAGRQWGP